MLCEEIEDVREADFRLAKPALSGSLEVFDLAHPAGQWVPSGTNLGHQISKFPQTHAAARLSGSID